MTRPWLPAEDALLLHAYEAAEPLAPAAQRLGRTIGAVRSRIVHLRRLHGVGVRHERRPFALQQSEAARGLVAAGASWRRVGVALGVTASRAKRWAGLRGLARPVPTKIEQVRRSAGCLPVGHPLSAAMMAEVMSAAWAERRFGA